MSKQIEVYSDGSNRSKSIIELVKKLACPKCEIVVHSETEKKGRSGPSVWIDGKEVDIGKLSGGVNHSRLYNGDRSGQQRGKELVLQQ
ncbi:hypothetical protein [Paenibacillus woosongensis]|uniref:Uncharacterized protein n=1 Tax=Paenibacillus woosongensis TaxID=307580 RepID=A0A7X2Z1H4_9BACL|nr:hypothetical protein [Paenibacillus woosongensis]MUG45861.1 hypothetical protein [Paenibacillus woosongensis]